MISLPVFCRFSVSHLHVFCPASKTSPNSFTSHFSLYFPFTLNISPLLLSCFLFCKVSTGSGRPDSFCCFHTFLRYLRFSNSCASSSSNDLICPTFFCLQPPLSFTYFSIISCYFISTLNLSKNSSKFFSHDNIFPPSHHFFTSQLDVFFSKKPWSCFLNCFSFAFTHLFPCHATSSLRKPWRISFSTHFFYLSFLIISKHPSFTSLPLLEGFCTTWNLMISLSPCLSIAVLSIAPSLISTQRVAASSSMSYLTVLFLDPSHTI